MFASRIKSEKSKGIYSLNAAKVIELKKKNKKSILEG